MHLVLVNQWNSKDYFRPVTHFSILLLTPSICVMYVHSGLLFKIAHFHNQQMNCDLLQISVTIIEVALLCCIGITL